MKSYQRLALAGTWALAASLAVTLLPTSALGASQGFTVTNLVADLPGVAAHTDTNLVNPWGLAFDNPGNLVVADNGVNLATFYQRSGNPIDLRVNVPGAPTGLVASHSPSDFVFGDTNTATAPARFLFCTESGTILAYHPAVNPTNAFVVVDHSRSNSVYKGLTLATLRGNRQIYAADFHNAKVDVFDTNFRFVGSFTDPGIPAGFAPFNVRNIGGIIIVTFA
ncbi:MAG: repeat family protein, partial [Pedosphaera sp.]|nr:repeat family protein [Pedosphaera sp.]